MAAAEATVTHQMRRGDLDEVDGGDLGSLLQPRFVRGPDENGVKKVVEYRFDEEGNKFRVTTIISPVGKLVRAPMTASGVPLVGSSAGGNVLMECMICCSKGHHWTAKCPSRSLPVVDKPPTANGPAPPVEGIKRAYFPPFMMGVADHVKKNVKKFINDDRCLQVTNLLEQTRESDLVQLCCKFGFVTCVYIPVDENGLGSGVGYVKFSQRREAEAAIKRLNGWTYNNLTLQVGWAAQL